MLHSRSIWPIYLTCAALVAAAVGWLSWRALCAEDAEATAQEQALVEENVRLALWRMDSAMAPFLAQENARPFEAYLPEEAAKSQGAMRQLALAPQVSLYFEVDPTGKFNSPQAGEEVGRRLSAVKKLIDRKKLLAELPQPVLDGEVAFFQGNTAVQLPTATNSIEDQNLSPIEQQRMRAGIEFQARSNLIGQNRDVAINNGMPGLPADRNRGFILHEAPLDLGKQRLGALQPMVVGGNLMLVRRADRGADAFVQGAWLDWPLLREELRGQVADLLPQARLKLVDEGKVAVDEGRRLASLPVWLDPGPVVDASHPLFSPVRLALIIAWGALLMTAAAVAALLRGVLALSERRADFVSAVTHELRTPLTTFRLYSEMLAEGMVADEAKRASYLGTLRREALRLSHLVENVLAYARLERGGLGNRVQDVSLDTLLGAVGERIGERAAQAGLHLVVDADEAVRQALVRADPSAVEQIVFNLVDNACKYAGATASDQRESAVRSTQDVPLRHLRLTATTNASRLCLRLADDGPGIPAEQRRRLFQPFSKSAEEAAQSAPGVGLGLALSRRLAREMGGDLWFDERATRGATFVLELPLAAEDVNR